MSASSTAIGGGGGARYGSIYPSGILLPRAFFKAFSRSICRVLTHCMLFFTGHSLISNRDMVDPRCGLTRACAAYTGAWIHQKDQGWFPQRASRHCKPCHELSCTNVQQFKYTWRKNTWHLPVPMRFRVVYNAGKQSEEWQRDCRS